jgi:hypothetical protein
MAKKLNKKGKVLEHRHLIDLALDTGKNGDELDKLMTLSVSRNELHMLCEILQGIGGGWSWFRLCLSIRLDNLTGKKKTWEKTNLFSIVHYDAFVRGWITIRVLRGDLFFPLYFSALQKFSQGQLSPEACNGCVNVFRAAGWQEAVRHLERELGSDSSQILDRILSLNGKDASVASVFANSIGS